LLDDITCSASRLIENHLKFYHDVKLAHTKVSAKSYIPLGTQ